MNIFDFQKKKENHEKISMITCYDYTSARILSKTTVD
ncbi:3-methyl-2-oxobutanoate hydroxymethyltransferase, partial [Klebsiella pneumoniae]